MNSKNSKKKKSVDSPERISKTSKHSGETMAVRSRESLIAELRTLNVWVDNDIESLPNKALEKICQFAKEDVRKIAVEMKEGEGLDLGPMNDSVQEQPLSNAQRKAVIKAISEITEQFTSAFYNKFVAVYTDIVHSTTGTPEVPIRHPRVNRRRVA